MYKVASEHVVESIGSKSLHCIDELNTADRFNVYCIVKKQSSFWFWEKPKMIPTKNRLEDLFLQGIQLPELSKSVSILENFEATPTGRDSSSIISSLNFKVGCCDTVNLTMTIGNVVKRKADFEKLSSCFKNKTVNVSHPLLTEIQNKRTTLCVVMESLSTQDCGDEPGCKFKVSVQPRRSGRERITHTYAIPNNTNVAYSCNEITIGENGALILHSMSDVYDQSKERLFKGKSDSSDPILSMKSKMHTMIHSSKFQEMYPKAREMLEELSPEGLHTFVFVLSSAEICIYDKTADRSIPPNSIRKLSHHEHNRSWRDLLVMMGFLFIEDSSEGKLRVEYQRGEHEALLVPFLVFIKAFSELDSDAKKLLMYMSVNDMKVLLDVIEKQIHGHPVPKKEVEETFKLDPITEIFLENIGFFERDGILQFITHHDREARLLNAYTVLYVFVAMSEKN